MTSHRDIMWSAGYAPAAAVAEAVGRELSTIHRWAEQEKFEFARSDRRLFVKLDSLEKLFVENPVVLERIAALRKEREAG